MHKKINKRLTSRRHDSAFIIFLSFIGESMIMRSAKLDKCAVYILNINNIHIDYDTLYFAFYHYV